MAIPVGLVDFYRLSQCALKYKSGVFITLNCGFVEVEDTQTDSVEAKLIETEQE